MSVSSTVDRLSLYVNRGITPKYTETLEEAIVVINQKCIRDFKVSFEPARLNDLTKRKVTEGKVLEKYDVLVNSTGVGTLGRVAQFYGESGSATVDSHVTIIRPDQDVIDPIYFGYLLKSKQRLIESFAEGTTGQTELARDSIKELELEHVENKNKQKEIGKVLLALDKKIELNRQTNQTLEQIAQAIFKSWFVDFEPVKAKIAAKHRFNFLSLRERAGVREQDYIERAAMCAISGKTLEQLDQLDVQGSTNIAGAGSAGATKTLDQLEQLSPDTLQQLKTTAALFPDTLVDSELGEIPEGWGVVRFKQIVEKYIDNRGKTPPIVEYGIPLLEVKHLPDDSIKPNLNTTKFVDEETYKNWFRAHLEEDDIIISTVGTIGKLCMVPKNERFTIAQNLLGMRFNKQKASPYFMYYQMDGFRFRHDVDARLIITVQASIKRKDLETIDLLSPPIQLQNIFENFAEPFVDMQQSNQMIELEMIRDTLLPKLLSGELSVATAQVSLASEEVQG